MEKLKNLNLNKKQIIGLVLILTALVAFFIPSAWVSAYWDTEFIETYQGFDIYYFPNINVYGIDIGGASSDWTYFTNPAACRNKIDLWAEGPIFVETYRDFTIYRLPGYNIYWGESATEKSSKWDNLDNLKHYIDVVFYPYLVYTIHSDLGDFLIYQQGYHDNNPVYWGEFGVYRTLDYSTKAKAIEAARLYIENHIDQTPEPTWEHYSTYGGFEIEIKKTSDGGYYYRTTVDGSGITATGLIGVTDEIDKYLADQTEPESLPETESDPESTPAPELEFTPPAQTGLEGRWWVNNVEITTSGQTIILNTTTMTFKFVPTKGRVSSVTISWTGTETNSKKLSKELFTSTWKTKVSLSEGTYTVTLYAEGADGELTLSLIGFSFSIPSTPDTGNANPDETVDTIGDYVQTIKNLVAGVSGSLGFGLFIFGSIKKEEEK